jgi:hypothetical protein
VDPVVAVVVLSIALFMPAGPELLDKDLMAVLVNTFLDNMRVAVPVVVLEQMAQTHRGLPAELVVLA